VVDEAKERSQLAVTIITLRSRKLWSQDTLSRHASKLSTEEISPKTVGNIESDRHNVTIGKLRAIAAALDVEVWQLFLPPVPTPALVRDITLEVSIRSEDDQRDLLKFVRKIPASGADPATPSLAAQRVAGQ
jgi:transcriptional regulator with XRE-family HTH domain